MLENVFLKDKKELDLEEYLTYDASGRGNLGDMIPVFVYRMLEYSLQDELIKELGKEKQVEIFRNAGHKAGECFAKQMLDSSLPLDKFVSQLQQKLLEQRIGVLRIEGIDENSGKFILTVAEDADCSGLPILGETVCHYDEGFIAGILSTYTGKNYIAVEIDCWATGDRVCRFCAEVKDD